MTRECHVRFGGGPTEKSCASCVETRRRPTQHILEGDFTDLTLGETFGPGMYACRPPGMLHGPWRTDAGALILEIRYPAPPDSTS
jgi:hypothetical protein